MSLISDKKANEFKESNQKSDMFSNYHHFFMKVTEKIADKI